MVALCNLIIHRGRDALVLTLARLHACQSDTGCILARCQRSCRAFRVGCAIPADILDLRCCDGLSGCTGKSFQPAESRLLAAISDFDPVGQCGLHNGQSNRMAMLIGSVIQCAIVRRAGRSNGVTGFRVGKIVDVGREYRNHGHIGPWHRKPVI